MKNFLQTLFFFLVVSQIGFAQWFQQNSGTTNSLNSLFFIDSNTGWVVGGDYNYGSIILNTADGGNNWTTQSSGTTHYLRSVYFIDSNTGWAVGEDLQDSVGTILKSTDGGNSWIFQSIQNTRGLYSVYFTDSNTGWFVGADENSNGTILKTTDGGNSWTLQYTVIWWFSATLYSVYFTDSNIGFAVGVLGGMESNTGIILKTTDGGNNWTTSTIPNPIYSVYFTDSNTGWAGGGAHFYGVIYKTTNGGNNWTPQTSGGILPLSSVYFTDSNTGWAVGTSLDFERSRGNILKTTDGGNTWTTQYFDTTSGFSSVYFTDSNTGWTVGWDGTILRTTNGGVTFVEEEQISGQPTGFLLSQNYPNPFNNSSVIRYSIPQSSQITIKIFNTPGEEIETLINEEKPAGTYELKWNAIDLPSGVYFYQLRAGDFIQTRKMVLLK